jgi:hypothetical protein
VRSVLTRWYEGRNCALCNRSFTSHDLWDHKPAVLSPDGVTREWREIATPDLPDALSIQQPVCWDCHVVATLYRKHPELVTERPWRDWHPLPASGHELVH